MAERMVEPIEKSGKASPQRKRRANWLREFDAAKPVVSKRSGGWCEVAGCDRPAVLFHHRAGRKVSGANAPERLLHVCLTCHLRVHDQPDWSYTHGYLERRT